MEKRLLLAFVLSAIVLYAFRGYLFPEPPAAPVSATTQSTPSPAPVPPPPVAPPPQAPEAVKTAPPQAVPEQIGDIHADKPEVVVVDTPLYTATVSSVGAVLNSFKPKAYKDQKGAPIELIDQAGSAKLGSPLAITTLDPKLDAALDAADFQVVQTGNRIDLEFAGSGIHARKTIIFDSDTFSLTIDSSLTRNGMNVPHNIAWQGGFGDQSIVYNPARELVVYPNNTSFKTLALSSIKDPQEMTVSRIGMEDQYFVAMFLLSQSESVHIRKQDYPGAKGAAVSTVGLAVPDPDSTPIRIYVGPKQEKWLVAIDPQLPSIIDYGLASVIAKPLLVALLWIQRYIGNFGWSIIILTLLINFALFPLRLKQQTSMQKMSKIQPQMRTLQDKFKKLKANDPRRMEIQSQMMGLYKEHGINPLSGCLPLLLQMPFLWAIWEMLTNAIELRNAPWMMWIHDLSLPDPYYIMPIVMAVTMIIMQRMTPTTVDPAQQKMMMIMPIMFAFIFLKYQSGLMLYWLTGNMVGIGQQFFINKYWAPIPAGKAKDQKDRDNKKSVARQE